MISKSQIRGIKRNRVLSREEGDYVILRTIPDGPHAPNKNEARALRRIMSQSGRSETEVRELPLYRRQLAKAAKPKSGLSDSARVLREALKAVTRQLKLAKEHPKVRDEFIRMWNERCTWRPVLSSFGGLRPLAGAQAYAAALSVTRKKRVRS